MQETKVETAVSLPGRSHPREARTDYFNGEHLRPALKGHAIRGARSIFIAQTCGYLVTTIGFMVLARLLTPEDFGLVAMVLPLNMILQNFGANGFSDAIIQKEAVHHQQVSTLFWINLAISIALSLLFLAAGPAIASFYNEPRLNAVVTAFSCSILVGGISAQHQALLKRNMEFHKTAFCEMVAIIVAMVVGIVLACLGFSYWALVARWLTIPVILAFASWILCGWRPGLPARNTGVRSIVRYGMAIYRTYLTTELRRNADKILLGRFAGSYALGFYERAYNFSTLLVGQMMNPLTNVALVTFSRLRNDPAEYRRNYLKVLSVLAFVCMPLSAALALVGKDLILLLLGSQWGWAGDLFSVLGLSTGVMMIYQTHAWHHLALGRTRRFWRWSMLSLFVTILLLVVGLPFGAMGVAVAYTASFYILIGPGLWYAGQPIQLSVSAVLSVLWKFFAAAFISGILCWFCFYGYGGTAGLFLEWYRLARIVTASTTFLLVYLTLIVLMFGSVSPITQFIAVVRQMMPVRWPQEASVAGRAGARRRQHGLPQTGQSVRSWKTKPRPRTGRRSRGNVEDCLESQP